MMLLIRLKPEYYNILYKKYNINVEQSLSDYKKHNTDVEQSLSDYKKPE